MTLIICDKNKELIEALKKENLKFRDRDVEIIIIEGDVFDVKKQYLNAKICTASNPSFSAGGGLDKALKEKYPNEWNNLKEFVWTDNLFPLISVDNNFKSSKSIILRALAGLYGYIRKFDFILTGIGTSIGGLSLIDFIDTLKRVFYANLSYANLRYANLGSANLTSADLSYTNLSSANLGSANLTSANLTSADLGSANLTSADLSYTNLSSANLSYANLSYANLSYANLSYANLGSANLTSADLGYTNLTSANLSYANLGSANLSQVKNMTNKTKEFMKNFKFNKTGMIVYKGIGDTSYPLNPNWKIKEGEYLEEVVNPCKNCDCGCGVNFGTKEYIKKEYPKSVIWECLIEFKDLVEVVVPYDTDGKARCSRLKLIKKLK